MEKMASSSHPSSVDVIADAVGSRPWLLRIRQSHIGSWPRQAEATTSENEFTWKASDCRSSLRDA